VADVIFVVAKLFQIPIGKLIMFYVTASAAGTNQTTTSPHAVFVTHIGGIIARGNAVDSQDWRVVMWSRKQMESNSEFGRKMTNLFFENEVRREGRKKANKPTPLENVP
jgi:hypothetical protein